MLVVCDVNRVFYAVSFSYWLTIFYFFLFILSWDLRVREFKRRNVATRLFPGSPATTTNIIDK